MYAKILLDSFSSWRIVRFGDTVLKPVSEIFVTASQTLQVYLEALLIFLNFMSMWVQETPYCKRTCPHIRTAGRYPRNTAIGMDVARQTWNCSKANELHFLVQTADCRGRLE